MLELKNLSITFNKGSVNERKALNNVSITINEGDFVTVIGSNGAGKSTLLNCISGSYESDNGSIILDNKNITFKAEHDRANYIGRLFQDPLKGTSPNMSIEENLSLAYTRGIKKKWYQKGFTKDDSKIFVEYVKQLNLGLEDRMSSKVGLLSGGQRQALTLLMATLNTPKLLLLDEHTAALDPNTAKSVMDLTDSIIKKDNITTLMITHNIEHALKYGNKTVVMNQGEVAMVLEGKERDNLTVEELLKLYTLNVKGNLSDKMLLD